MLIDWLNILRLLGNILLLTTKSYILDVYNRNQTLHKWYSITFLSVWYKIAYTRVNKCKSPNLQGNMHLILNMRLKMKGNYWPHPQNHSASSVAHVHGSKWLQYLVCLRVWSMDVILTRKFDAKNRRVACGDRWYCIVEILQRWSRWANSWHLEPILYSQ